MRNNEWNLANEIAGEALGAGGGGVAEAVIGLGYTMVSLSDGRCGVAYTPAEGLARGCESFDGAGTISGRVLSEVIPLIGSDSLIASAVGLAAANAVLRPPEECLGTDLFEALALKRGELVTMVGWFKPVEKRLRGMGVEVEVVERGNSPEPLSRCDVALITATTIINGTIEGVLADVGSAREVVLLGPSTPYAPTAFNNTVVTVLAGSTVADPDRVRQVVCEGGGTRTMGKALSRWVARL